MLKKEFYSLKSKLHSLSLLPSTQTSSYSKNDKDVEVVDTLESHIFSGLFSNLFLFKRNGMVEGDDIPSILSRASYHLSSPHLDSSSTINFKTTDKTKLEMGINLEEEELIQTIVEMQNLKGRAKLISQDWINDLTDYLQVKLVLNVVKDHLIIESSKQ